ncbi:MAG: heavy metal translocating P-type ATPase [Burkholderiaceae bacterium]
MQASAGFEGIDRESLRRAGRMVASVEGMWCGSCAMAVERIIARVPGVTAANISFAGGSALIRWDPARFDLDELLSRVERLGYRMVPLIASDEMEQRIDAEAGAVWTRLAVAAFFGMWSMLGSIALYLDADLAASGEGWWIALVTSLAAVPAVTYSAWAFYRAGWRTALAGVPGMDALVSLGVLASCLLSVWQLAHGSAHVYVDTATMLVCFLLCGRLIELYARRRNSAAVNALKQAVPETVRILVQDGTWTEAPASEVRLGDQVLIYAGERIAVDGIVIDGESDIDRSLVTGESTPVAIQSGGSVEAGCVNLSCPIHVRVEKLHGQRFIDRIGVRMLELFGEKSTVALLAERFARWLIPFALGLATLAFAYAYVSSGDAMDATLRALSVLVAACPCAVGLALPLAYATSAATAARNGILFRDPASMESLAQAKEILFDKTGTLTTGKLEVAEIVAADSDSKKVLHWAGMAEIGIAHPIACAIRDAAQRVNVLPLDSNAKIQRHARGTEWQSEDRENTVLVGAQAWLESRGVAVPDRAERAGRGGTSVQVALNGRWIGTIFLGDTVRPGAADAVAALQDHGLKAKLVTGDGGAASHAVAGVVGLTPQQVYAGCTPEQKVDIVRQSARPVVFVGDGVNDSLALAAANCGVAVPGASTAAVATAGVVIADGGMDNVVASWRHARRTLSVVRQNLIFSVIYNAGILGFAATGMVPPAAAAAAMLASSLSVVGNAARLAKFR